MNFAEKFLLGLLLLKSFTITKLNFPFKLPNFSQTGNFFGWKPVYYIVIRGYVVVIN